MPLENTILQTLQSGDMYESQIASRICPSDIRRMFNYGTLYKTLSRLVEAGLLVRVWESSEIAERENRPRRRLYRLMPAQPPEESEP